MTAGRDVSRYYQTLARPDAQMSPASHRAVLERLLDRARLSRAELAVDLGAGIGLNLPILRRRFRRVVALDLSERALRHARDEQPEAAGRVGYTVADACRIPLSDGCADAVVCTEVLEHVPAWEEVRFEMRRVLRSGGIAVVSTPNYANPVGLRKWWHDRRAGQSAWEPWGAHEGGYERFVTARGLRRLFRTGFRLIGWEGSEWAMGWLHGLPVPGGRYWAGILERLASLPLFRATGMHVHLLLQAV